MIKGLRRGRERRRLLCLSPFLRQGSQRTCFGCFVLNWLLVTESEENHLLERQQRQGQKEVAGVGPSNW